MTVREVQALVARADPEARHYTSTKDGNDFTVWREYQRIGISKDDVSGGGWKFQIDRYTKEEFDATADTIEKVLTNEPGVAFGYLVDYEEDTGYIHHIFDCEGY